VEVYQYVYHDETQASLNIGMASVHKKKGSQYWFAFFKIQSGKLVSRSTKERDRKKAERIAELYEDAYRKRRTAQQIKSVLNTVLKTDYSESLPVATVRNFFKSWLDAKRPETAESTFDFYTQTINSFLTHLGNQADLEIGSIARKDIVAYRNCLVPKLSSTTVNHRIKTLRMIFKAATRDSFITENPVEYVEAIKKSGQINRRPFTIPELKAVLAVAQGEWRSLILLGFYTGQRLGDLALLEWRSIDFERNEIRLVTRKTGKTLLIPMAPPLREYLLSVSHLNDVQLIHPKSCASVNRSRGRVASLSNQFSDLLAQAGLRKKIVHTNTGKGRNTARQGSELSFHCLRHSAVSLLKDAGIPQAVVMELIGHDSIDASHRYTHVGEDALKKAAAAFPEL
jgi:integrase